MPFRSSHSRLHYLRQDLSPERGRLAREALAPSSPATLMARGYFSFWYERNADAALEQFSAVAKALPSGGGLVYSSGLAFHSS